MHELGLKTTATVYGGCWLSSPCKAQAAVLACSQCAIMAAAIAYNTSPWGQSMTAPLAQGSALLSDPIAAHSTHSFSPLSWMRQPHAAQLPPAAAAPLVHGKSNPPALNVRHQRAALSMLPS